MSYYITVFSKPVLCTTRLKYLWVTFQTLLSLSCSVLIFSLLLLQKKVFYSALQTLLCAVNSLSRILAYLGE